YSRVRPQRSQANRCTSNALPYSGCGATEVSCILMRQAAQLGRSGDANKRSDNAPFPPWTASRSAAKREAVPTEPSHNGARFGPVPDRSRRRHRPQVAFRPAAVRASWAGRTATTKGETHADQAISGDGWRGGAAGGGAIRGASAKLA